MKKLVLVLMLLALVACAGGSKSSLSPQEKIAEVKDTSQCKFIKKAQARGMDNLNLTRDIQRTVYNLGGDSYKIISTSNEIKGTVSVTNAKISVWKCR
jgi:hypothetical protein